MIDYHKYVGYCRSDEKREKPVGGAGGRWDEEKPVEINRLKINRLKMEGTIQPIRPLGVEIFESPLNSFMYDLLSLQVSSNYQFVWPTRLIILATGEVLSFGFNLAVSFPSDSRGSKARIVLLPSRIKRWGLYHIA